MKRSVRIALYAVIGLALAAYVVWTTRQRLAVSDTMARLREGGPAERLQAVRELSRPSGTFFPRVPAGQALLQAARSDDDPAVRAAALEAVTGATYMGQKDLVGAVIDGLRDAAHDPDPGVRAACMSRASLAQTTVRVMAPLREADLTAILAAGALDPDPQVRRKAIFGLGTAGPGEREAVEAALRKAADDPKTGAAARFALERLAKR